MAADNVFGEKYVLLKKLDQGGMAEIFLARQIGLGGFQKELVIKRIHQNLTENEQYVELFLDEARIAANLNHPNIVHIYDIGKAFNTYYIAMEYIKGADLSAVCQKAENEGAKLPIRHGVEIIRQAADGLAFAHAFKDKDGSPLDIIHRDISPSNILVTFGGITKIVDFGIAKATSKLHDDTGMVMGKLGYMAPELIEGQPATVQTDLFALGVVLYETTLGKRLFRGTEQVIINKIRDEPIAPPSVLEEDYPTDLEVIVMRLLEKRPENRYEDATELLHDLQDLQSEMGWKAGPQALARYLAGLYEINGAALELDVDDLDVLDEEIDDDAPTNPGGFNPKLRPPEEVPLPEEDEGELIFASRLPDPFDGE